jgi:hypothetical protein
VLLLGIVGAFYVTQKPAYLSRYGGMQRSYSSMQASSHKDLPCTACHSTPGGPIGYQVALVGDFYANLFRKPGYLPTFVTLGAPTREKCLNCHAYDWSMNAERTSKVPHPAHLRAIDEKRDCVTCHRWTAHEEVYQQQHTKMPFSVVCASFGCHVGWKQPPQCKNCHHQLQQSLGVWKEQHPAVVRVAGPNGCLEKCHNANQCRECHTTGKTPVFPKTIAPSTVTTIEVAHVKSDWLSQHGAFALQDKQKCLICHVTFQECKDCHEHKPAFHGTDNTAWIGTGHEKFAKANPKRCFACHEPAECNNCHTQFQAQDAPQYLPSASENATL